jgi:hypothetical protein
MDALMTLEAAFGSGLPGLSLAKWAATAASLKPRPSHLSVYDLQVESAHRCADCKTKCEKKLPIVVPTALHEHPYS